MKIFFYLFLPLLFLVAFSCNDSDDLPEGYNEYLIATPITEDLITFKAEAIAVTEPTEIIESGKVYAYREYIFVNDVNRGLHVLDNTDPTSPQRIAFIKLEGNNDISIKNNRLYADSYGDLVIMDISDITNIGDVQRIENAIYTDYFYTMDWNLTWPEADAIDYSDYDINNDAIVGWEINTVTMTQEEFEEQYICFDCDIAIDMAETASDIVGNDSDTGQGGSLARFRIVGDYLYAVEWSSINIFDISDLDNPQVLEEVYTDWGIETIFSQGDVLFLGGTQGMYIYDISEPATPTYISEFVHGTACDPVVVDGNYAYVTLRGGNACGSVESGLYIVDISNLESPELMVIYPMEEPYGLGVKDEKLFICDGTSGLKVYDKSNVPTIELIDHVEGNMAYDVIPMAEQLLMVGNGMLYQFEYMDDGIQLISELQLN